MTTQASVKVRPQIFLSFALADREFAQAIGDELRRAGLSVVRMADLEARGEYTEGVRDALRRSAAVVVALSDSSIRHEVPASVLFEIGAAMGAEKPIYVIVDRPSIKLPFGAPGMHVLSPNRLDEIARSLGAGAD